MYEGVGSIKKSHRNFSRWLRIKQLIIKEKTDFYFEVAANPLSR